MSTQRETYPESAGERLEETVGRRVRQYRQEAGLSSAELAARTGLSPAMISRIESASTSASLTSISRLAQALQVPVSALFRGVGASTGAVFTRAGEGTPDLRAGSKTGHRYYGLGNLLSNIGPSLEPVIVELDEHTSDLPMYEHPGIEFLYVLSGRMSFRHGDDVYDMAAGDSILLDAEAAHGPTAVLESPVAFLSVNPVRS